MDSNLEKAQTSKPCCRDGLGFLRAGRAVSRDFPRAKPEGNPESKNSVLAFLKCMDASVLAFIKCTDGSVLVFLKCMDGSVLAHLRFPMQSAPTRFPQSGNSEVP